MVDRKKTPDLLGAVIDRKETTVKKAKQKARKPVKQNTIKTAYHNTIKSTEKVKATYYISQDAIDALEDVQYQLRKLAGDRRSRVSKSLIVEVGVKMALEDVEKKGEGSRFLKELFG